MRVVNILIVICFLATSSVFVFYMNQSGQTHSSTPEAALKASTPEAALKETVNKLWQAKASSDWGTVYDMCASAYKKAVEKDTFVKRANVNVEVFSVKDVKITEPDKKAVAAVDFTIKQMGYEFKLKDRKEEWIQENGEWRLNLDPFSTPLGKSK